MKRIWIGLAAAAALTIASPPLAQAAQPSASNPADSGYDAGAALRDTFRDAAAARDFSGAIAIRRNGALIAYESFGAADFETGQAITPETLFPAGRLTRSVTVALIAYLEDRGYLARQDRLSRFLPDLAGAGHASIDDLLHGRAGLPDTLPGRDGRSLIAGLNAAGGIRPGPHPATDGAANWRLLALVAERAAGGAYETLAGARLFSPLDMHASSFRTDAPAASASLARPYRPGPAPFALRPAPPVEARRGDSGWLATIDDLLAWGEAIESRRVDLFTADGRMLAGFELDLSRGMAIYTAEARQPGFSVGMAVIPDIDLTLVWAVNVESWPADNLAETLRTIAWEGRPVDLPERPGETALTNGHRLAIGGFDWPGEGAARIVEDGAGLWLERGDGERFFLTPSGEQRLHLRRLNLHLVYRVDDTGWLTALDATWPDGTGFQLVRTDERPAPPAEPAP